MKKTVKKVLVALFLLTFLAMFFIVGSMEQEYITIGQAITASAINFAIMIFSGYKAGILEFGGNYGR